ncbi:MAG: phage holin family protein [Spirochaetaceae bacterium]|nr:phage holin family protein [Spirochaetaceae bacterium]
MEIYELIQELNFANLGWQIFTPLCFSLADYITGYIQALINKDVQSRKMRVGLLHKTLILLVIILSFVIDFAFNLKYVSSFVCIYVTLMEITSIFENLKKAGINLGKFGKALEVTNATKKDEKIEKIVKIINDKEDQK